MASEEAIAQTLASIVGAIAVCPYTALETYQQQRITQAVTTDTQVACIVYPSTQTELAEVITCAAQNNWRILPSGSGSKLHWGGLVEGINIVVSTKRLSQLIRHAVGDLTVTLEAGHKFNELQTILAKEGQFLALDPAYPDATVGGIIATADTGSLRQRYGGVRDMLLGITLVRADGQIAKAGGQVVKNVAGYDLMKLLTGSYGTLGVLSQVTLRVYPLSLAAQTVILTGKTAAIAQAARTLLASALTPTAIDLLTPPLMASLGLGADMGLIVRFQSIKESVEEQAARLLEVGRALGLRNSLLGDQDEAAFWQQSHVRFWSSHSESAIICKMGVLPSVAIATLSQIHNLIPEVMGRIHVGSGLGTLQFSSAIDPQTLLEVRFLCQEQGGFLSILQAPVTLKQQLDVWGYTGDALNLMRGIKQQFDPKNLLSPNRFVGVI